MTRKLPCCTSRNSSNVYLNNNPVIQKAETDLCISTGLIDDDLFRWRICFQGPEGTPFEGGLYEATLTFPDDFPHMPPKMLFKTEMFHPNSNSRSHNSLSNWWSVHLDITSTFRGPYEPAIESIREMESHPNNWGCDYEYHFDAGWPEFGLPGQRRCCQTLQIKREIIQQENPFLGQEKYRRFLNTAHPFLNSN